MERGTYFERHRINDWRESENGHEDGYVRHQVEERRGEYLEEGEIVQDQRATVQPSHPGHNFVPSQDGWKNGDGAFTYPEQLEYNSALHTSPPENRTADSGYVEARSKAGSNHEGEVHHHQGGDLYFPEDRLATEPIWAAHGFKEYPHNAEPYQYHSYETAEVHNNAEPAQQDDTRAHEPGNVDKFQGSFYEGYPHYDASQDFSGYWKEGDASSDLQHSSWGHAQEAQTYNYADHGTYYAYRQEPYVAETCSAPSDNQSSGPGSGYISAPGANQRLEASNADDSTLRTVEGIATKHEPVKRAVKKPDKAKFVLGKNK
jgi:hypothetical protein